MAKRTLQDFKTLDVEYHQVGSTNQNQINPFSPCDGFVDPYMLTMAYMKDAKYNGASIIENCEVTGIIKEDKKYIIQSKNNIPVSCERIFNLSGLFAQTFFKRRLNVCYMRSHYWEFASTRHEYPQPIILLPGLYIKFQRYKIEVGIQEKQSLVVNNPANFYSEEPIDALIDNYPILQQQIDGFDSATVQSYVSGLSTYTPDGLPVIDYEDPNFITVSGCNGYGITWSGGL